MNTWSDEDATRFYADGHHDVAAMKAGIIDLQREACWELVLLEDIDAAEPQHVYYREHDQDDEQIVVKLEQCGCLKPLTIVDATLDQDAIDARGQHRPDEAEGFS